MASYTAELIGHGGRRVLRLESWFGARVEVSDGAYVLVGQPPAFPPSGEHCIYRWEASDGD